ncbi:MAG: HDOD domain-containing protein [Pseudomonadota bacterium]|nr:HDOD domain-containing protein [Pseudomonadota bacterium]
MTSLAAARTLTEPFPTLAAWMEYFREAEIPVLEDTSRALEAMRLNEDRVDANSIGEMIAIDPLMTLKVLAYEAAHRGHRVVTAAETVTSALVMMGISPFFQAFSAQPTVEERLLDAPKALTGFRLVLQRAHRSANFALAFANHRTDPDAASLHAAALLHEFAELLLWCHAPELALRILRAQANDPQLRSNVAQLGVLKVELLELQQALVEAWQLPPLLSEGGNRMRSHDVAARIVALSARLARHAARGWDNAALPDDIAELSELLNLSPSATMTLVRDIQAE